MNSGFTLTKLTTIALVLTSGLWVPTGTMAQATIPEAESVTAPEPIAPTASPVAPTEIAPVVPMEIAPVGSAAPPAQTVPALAEPPVPELSEVFIDRTDYNLGATERETFNVAVEVIPRTTGYGEAPASPVNSLGNVNLANSSSWGSLPVSYSLTTPEARTTPLPGQGALEYFSRKLLRSVGRMGNENVKLLFPLGVPASITSLFGWRTHPITGTQRLHTGTDIGADMGTPVLAALAGKVILADDMGGYGLAIALEHNSGIQQTLYGHLSEIFVKPGEMIQQGSVIGRVGSTGASTGPHLHFEFRQMTQDGSWVAMDSGEQLEIALGDLTRSLQVAQKQPNSLISIRPITPGLVRP
jgi:murein DD-endopeptidase MepM/ murein hydrolase activator NlpD